MEAEEGFEGVHAAVPECVQDVVRSVLHPLFLF
jgi:hypothetical protein